MDFNGLLDFLYELEASGVIIIDDQDLMTEKLEEFLESNSEALYNTFHTD